MPDYQEISALYFFGKLVENEFTDFSLEKPTWLKLGDFLEFGKTGDRSYLAEDSRREYYLQSKSSPLQVMCIILRKSPPLGNPCLQTWPAEK